MKKNILLIYLSAALRLFQSCLASAELPLEDLYFVAGSPQTDFYSTEPVVLYSFDKFKKRLSRLRAISSLKQGAEFVRPYYDDGVLLVGSLIEPSYFQIDMVEFSAPEKERSVEVKICNKCDVVRSHMSNVEGSLNYILMLGHTMNGVFDISLRSINLLTGLVSNLDFSKFGDVKSYGASGGNVEGADILPSIFSESGDAVFGYNDRVDLNWQLPKDIDLDQKEYVIQLANNDKFRVIMINRGFESNELVPQSLIYTFSKKENKWSSFRLDGNRLRVRVFDEWLVSEKAFDGFTREDELVSYDKRVAEALGQRHALVERHGEFVKRLSKLNVSQSGVLMIRNLLTGLYLELKTNSEDSEILLVDDDHVVYRDGGKIMISVIKNNTPEQAELLVDDDRARSIHWAFSKN